MTHAIRTCTICCNMSCQVSKFTVSFESTALQIPLRMEEIADYALNNLTQLATQYLQ